MRDHSREKLAQSLLEKQFGSLKPEEAEVIDRIGSARPISRHAGDVADARSTFGDRLADRVAAVGGSWGFIICFSLVLFGWMLLNTDILTHWGLSFDPYPYIFLNLMLSTLAAVQAPVIMMSQNRQAAKDRLSASLDYEVNLRAELEILRLHEKIDCAVIAKIDELFTRLDKCEADLLKD
jgi:uncharacterized membrane protein